MGWTYESSPANPCSRSPVAPEETSVPVIDFESVGFSGGVTFPNGPAQLAASWDELLWAALTVGRPNVHYVFQHGQASAYEALFRLSLVRMALEQAGPMGLRFRRTSAVKAMDPSEKGAVSYFLGLNLAKLFAYRLLGVPWLLHLDVFRPHLSPVLTGRSRPDLIGANLAGDLVALECKGRISAPNAKAKAAAKAQAQRVVSIGGVAPTWSVGAITYFWGDVLRFYWEDPPATRGKGIAVPGEPDAWRYHFLPILGLLRTVPDGIGRASSGSLVRIPEADVEVGVHPSVLDAVLEGRWDAARAIASNQRFEPPYMADGIAVVAGQSWIERYTDPGLPPRRRG